MTMFRSNVLFGQGPWTPWQMILSAYTTGLPADEIHAFATVLFLWFLSEPMLEKLDRVKVKYGLIEK